MYPAHVMAAVRGPSAQARRPRGVSCVSGAGPFDGVVAERAARNSSRSCTINPREPLPDTISWQTERVDRFNRAHWLIIDRLGAVEGESRLPDTNLLHAARELDFGLRINSTVDRGRRAHEVVAGLERVSDRPARRRSVRRGERQARGQRARHRAQRWRSGRRAIAYGSSSSGTAIGACSKACSSPRRSRCRRRPSSRGSKPSGRVDLVAARKCRRGVDRRRESIHAAAVAVDLRLPAADHGASQTGARCSRASSSRAWRQC